MLGSLKKTFVVILMSVFLFVSKYQLSELVYPMYIQYIFNVYSMYIQCIFNVYSMYIQCIFRFPYPFSNKSSIRQNKYNFVSSPKTHSSIITPVPSLKKMREFYQKHILLYMLIILQRFFILLFEKITTFF